MKRPCLRCGVLIRRGSYCRRCSPNRKRRRITPGRGSGAAAAKFRREVLARADGRCERCGSVVKVMAHHKRPLRDGGTNEPSNGEALCSGRGGCHWIAEAEWRRRSRQ